MQGVNIKSFDHLGRNIEDGTVRVGYLRDYHGRWSMFFARVHQNKLIMANACVHSVSGCPVSGLNLSLEEKYSCYEFVSYELGSNNCNKPSQFMRRIGLAHMILLPAHILQDYESDMSKKSYVNILRSVGIGSDTTNHYVFILYSMTGQSTNLFQWAMNCVYKHKVDIETIKRVINWIDKYSQLSKSLIKNTVTAYNSFSAVCSLVNEQIALRQSKQVNEVINTFNTAQKKLLRDDVQPNTDDFNAISQFANLSLAKRENLIRKVSTIEDYGELIKMIKHAVSYHFDWNKESVIGYIENVDGINAKIVYETDTALLLKVDDFDTIKKLCKTTNWCISKNKSYWNQYLERGNSASQFVLFDFSKPEDTTLSIIGFTSVKNRGITNAHDFFNNDIMGRQETNEIGIFDILHKHCLNVKMANNIYGFLKANNIPLDLVLAFDSNSYKWNKEAFLHNLKKGGIDTHYINILKDGENILVISVKDENIVDVISPQYAEMIPNEFWNKEHIIFADFSKPLGTLESLRFAIIDSVPYGEDVPLGVFDNRCTNIGSQNLFDSLLYKYGLPYNTIRRPDSVAAQYKSGFFAGEMDLFLRGICDDKNIDELREMLLQNDAASVVAKTITEYTSLDILNAIYGNGKTIEYVFGTDGLQSITQSIIIGSEIALYSGSLKNEIPSQELLELWENSQIVDQNIASFITCYQAIELIKEHENLSRISTQEWFNNVASSLPIENVVFDKLIETMLQRHDFTKNCLNKHIIQYLKRNTNDALKELVAKAIGANKEMFIETNDNGPKMASFATFEDIQPVYANINAVDGMHRQRRRR